MFPDELPYMKGEVLIGMEAAKLDNLTDSEITYFLIEALKITSPKAVFLQKLKKIFLKNNSPTTIWRIRKKYGLIKGGTV